MPSGVRKRAKAKSSIHKVTVRDKDRQRRPVQPRDPVLARHWDRRRTVKENFKQLGLSLTADVDTRRPQTVQTARIVRDEKGNVCRVEYPELSASEVDHSGPPSEAVLALEKRADALAELAKANKRVVASDDSELDWLHRLRAKHADNYEAMQRDHKLNKFQESAGVLRRRMQRLIAVEQ